MISWRWNHCKDQSIAFCFQHVVTTMNAVREADDTSLMPHWSLHWFCWGGFCFSFVFLRDESCSDTPIPLLLCLATKKVSKTFCNILHLALKKNLAFLVINSYVWPKTFLAMNIVLKETFRPYTSFLLWLFGQKHASL